MADSVALLFATNLATIGGHVAEMISIFVYPVIGYFWTRRRRRSSLVDFNILEEPPSSMPTAEYRTDSIDALAKCITHLVAVLQALGRLTVDEALPKIPKGSERFDELLQEHRELQRDVIALTKKLSDKTMKPDDAIAHHTVFDISQSVRLLQLKEEMLALEVQQSKIIYCRSEHSRYTEGVDLELGIADSQPVSRAAPRLEDSVRPVTPESSQREATLHPSLASMTAAEIHSCLPLSQWLLEELSPAREQLLREMVSVGRNVSHLACVTQAERSSTMKALPRYGKRRGFNSSHPPVVSS